MCDPTNTLYEGIKTDVYYATEENLTMKRRNATCKRMGAKEIFLWELTSILLV